MEKSLMSRCFTLALGLAVLLIPSTLPAEAPAEIESNPSEAKATTITFFGDSTMTVPADFEPAEKGSRMLEYEFAAKSGEGDQIKKARLTFMPSGGGVPANIKRWQGQFVGGDADAKKTEVMEVGKWKIHVVDNNGTFADSMGRGPFAGGKVIKRTDWGMTGAILEHPNGQLYFVKMIGPGDVVKANREAMMTMLKSVK
jgi:hypothetical protein